MRVHLSSETLALRKQSDDMRTTVKKKTNPLEKLVDIEKIE